MLTKFFVNLENEIVSLEAQKNFQDVFRDTYDFLHYKILPYPVVKSYFEDLMLWIVIHPELNHIIL